jgi:hypothetical protein
MRSAAVCVVLVALCASPQIAAAQSGTAPFCLQTNSGTRCVFSTMGECESARVDGTLSQCITRTDAQGTTGLGERPIRSYSPPFGPPPSPGR